MRDGGHVILDCADCGEKLVDIWRTDPEADFKHRYRADCPCGGHSFEYEVAGLVYPGPYGEDKDDDDSDSVCRVATEDVDVGDELTVFKMRWNRK